LLPVPVAPAGECVAPAATRSADPKDAFGYHRAAPRNKGELPGQKPPLKLKEIWAIRIRLRLAHRTRELAL
jgi:hypothetical protein